MIFRQYLAINPVAAFYLFGCGGEGVAAAVDPLGDLDRYLCDADKTHADEPWLAFTGHTLMVGDLDRTELASSAEEGARALFQSVRRLISLPDYVEIYSGAFNGSVCERSLSGKPASTIGFERRHNRALADESAFIAFMAQEVPPRPQNAGANRSANTGLAVIG